MNFTQSAQKITAASVQLSVAGVSKHFGGVSAVEDVSLDVPKGRILSIIGPNGAGKTSLLNMISGFYKPDTGRIMLEGRDITRNPPSRIAALGIARTFQNIALFSGLTVLDNLMLGRHVRMRSGVLRCVLYWGLAQREEIRHRAACEEIIEFLKLQDLRKQPTAALAYGLRKRVELGRALALEPKLLLLDEWLAGLNPTELEEGIALIEALRLDGMSIVMVEHVMDAIHALCDRCVVMNAGRIIAEGTPRLALAEPEVVRAYLGEPDA
jgi:branched-chain amino acid transport system ATP-binding protein